MSFRACSFHIDCWTTHALVSTHRERLLNPRLLWDELLDNSAACSVPDRRSFLPDIR